MGCAATGVYLTKICVKYATGQHYCENFYQIYRAVKYPKGIPIRLENRFSPNWNIKKQFFENEFFAKLFQAENIYESEGVPFDQMESFSMSHSAVKKPNASIKKFQSSAGFEPMKTDFQLLTHPQLTLGQMAGVC